MAWNLRRLRVARGLSQDGLALEAGVDRTYVGRLERSIENPTVGVLERLGAALDAKLIEFFVEPEPGSAPPPTLKAGRRATAGGGRAQSTRSTKITSSSTSR